MELKTGYFAYGKRYEEMGYCLVSIARWIPKGFKGLAVTDFAPSWDLLHALKDGKVTEDEFTKEYLSSINKDAVRNFLDNLKSKYDKVILLCWEKSCDFCHRHLLAEYIRTELGFDIDELVIQK